MNPPHDTSSSSYEFYFPGHDTLLQVEQRDEQVVVRTTTNSISDRRKEYFIRELAAEGFIPAEYQWQPISGGKICWVLDRSWLHRNLPCDAHGRALIIRLFVGALCLWIVLLSLVFCHVI